MEHKLGKQIEAFVFSKPKWTQGAHINQEMNPFMEEFYAENNLQTY